MPSLDLTKHDPLVATDFWLEIDGEVISYLTSVDGLQLELETGTLAQRDAGGKYVQMTVLGKPKMTGELTIKRVSPLDVATDPLWKWFTSIRDKGMSPQNRSGERKSGSVVIYGTNFEEVARWNFYNAWPSKIATDGFEVSKNDPVQETVTLQYEKLERKK